MKKKDQAEREGAIASRNEGNGAQNRERRSIAASTKASAHAGGSGRTDVRNTLMDVLTQPRAKKLSSKQARSICMQRDRQSPIPFRSNPSESLTWKMPTVLPLLHGSVVVRVVGAGCVGTRIQNQA